jgi:CRISPR type III-associated protein (TIGR04423 family)
MKKNRNEIVEFINSLKGYQGYVQFSDRPIEHIYTTATDVQIDPQNGFVYEAHFYNGTESIAIKQVNESWLVSRTDISNVPDTDIVTYFSSSAKVKMAQIWEPEADELCDGIQVKKLKKVLFAGFVPTKGEEQ